MGVWGILGDINLKLMELELKIEFVFTLSTRFVWFRLSSVEVGSHFPIRFHIAECNHTYLLHGSLGALSSILPHVCFQLYLGRWELQCVGLWRDGSVVNSACCSWRGCGFISSVGSLQLLVVLAQKDPLLLASVDSSYTRCTLTDRQAHTEHINMMLLSNFCLLFLKCIRKMLSQQYIYNIFCCQKYRNGVLSLFCLWSHLRLVLKG